MLRRRVELTYHVVIDGVVELDDDEFIATVDWTGDGTAQGVWAGRTIDRFGPDGTSVFVRQS